MIEQHRIRDGFTLWACRIALPLIASTGLLAAEPLWGSELVPPMPVRGFLPSGALRERMMLNFDRLDSARYAPVENSGCLREASYAWPGDMEGRALLAFVRLERATGRRAAHLENLRSIWASRLNAQGYFGKQLDPQAIDEQQLAGHGWVLRGLCELYEWKHDAGVLKEIRAIVEHLGLPTRGAHADYPIDPALRMKGKGGISGEHIEKTGRWVLSSDIGCDLIFMDGLMHAASLLHDSEVDALCEEILARSLQIDLPGIQAQTHATLTGVRGILRWAVLKNRPQLVAEAEKRFQLYTREGMSENNENWNWFGRPKHTEPCAVVDSFMVANELWRLTAKPEYLAWVHRIVYNGIYAEQGPNGGFGCSAVTRADGARALRVVDLEAWFCCSMRAAEGFAELAQCAFHSDGQSVYVTGFSPGKLSVAVAGAELIGTVVSGYPVEGRWTMDVQAAPAHPVAFHLFTPPWAAHPVVTLNQAPVEAKADNGFTNFTVTLKPGDRLAFSFEQGLYSQPSVTQNPSQTVVSYHYGPLILALSPGAPAVRSLPSADAWRWDECAHIATAPGIAWALSPLGERYQRADPDIKHYARQLLFEIEGAAPKQVHENHAFTP